MICTVAVTKEDNMYIAKDILTSVVDQGYSIDEALLNLKEALELYYDDNNIPSKQNMSVYMTTIEVGA